MDALHDDLCRSPIHDLTCDLVYPEQQDVPAKHRPVLCDKCKANPKKLCRKCARAIARLLAGGHASSTDEESDTAQVIARLLTGGHAASTADEESDGSTSSAAATNSSEGYLIIGESVNVTKSSSQVWELEAAASAQIPIHRSASQPEADIKKAYAKQQQRQRREWVASARKGLAEAERARAEEEQALAREIARFNAWLGERRAHRRWQDDILQVLSLTPTRRREFLLKSVRICACHGDPDCRVLIDMEYEKHLALAEADRVYKATDGRGICRWAPFLGRQAKTFWVEKEMAFQRRLADGESRAEVGQLEVHLGYAVGLWRMEVILGNVWGRLPNARWRVQRTERQGSCQGWIRIFTFWNGAELEKEQRVALLRLRDVERGKRPKLDRDNFKGCLLFERNPCWALLPLLRDGGDVGLVWRWERVAFENTGIWPFGNPFVWLWRACAWEFAGAVVLWKWLTSWILGSATSEEEEDDDGELD